MNKHCKNCNYELNLYSQYPCNQCIKEDLCKLCGDHAVYYYSGMQLCPHCKDSEELKEL